MGKSVARHIDMNIQPHFQEANADALSYSLQWLSHYHGISTPADTIRAGLPLVDNKLTPDLFIRAASRIGLKAKLVERQLGSVSSLVLPAVILLHSHEAALLLSIDRHAKTATLLSHETEGEVVISLRELGDNYRGQLILVSKQYVFNEHNPELLKVNKKHWFWGSLTKSWRIYRDVLIASFMVNIFALASPLFIMNVYDRVVPNQAIETLWVLASGILIVHFFDFVMRMLRGFFIDVAGKKSDVLLSSSTFEWAVSAKSVSQPQSAGAFANNLRDFESIREFITSATFTSLVDFPFVVLFLSVIYFIAGELVFIPLVGVVLIIIFGLMIQSPLRTSIDQQVRASTDRHAKLVESLYAIDTIKFLGLQGMMQNRWERITGYIAETGIRSRLLGASSLHVAQLIQHTVSVAVVIAGVYLNVAGQLSLGGIIAIVILSGRALAPMAQVAGLAARYYHAKAAYIALNRMMQLPTENDELVNSLSPKQLTGEIVFSGVSFHYPNEQHGCLDALSFSIKAGEKVAIIGRMGAGKTTIQKLILRLHEASCGSIQMDGLDINQIDPYLLRKNIAYVDQNPTLFLGTLKENILCGNTSATDDDILWAADKAGVSDFANRHPEGFNMQVGERGERLSTGQKQSVALARAFLSDAPLLMLDEPSSALDDSSEKALKQHLHNHAKDKTLVLITHRTSMLELVDRLIIVDQGRVIADGPKDQVLAGKKV